MTTNTDTVLDIYGAFGRGDVQFILDRLSDDVVWDQGIRRSDVPYLQPRTGKDDVAGFFSALVENLEFTTFEPGAPCANDDTVVVIIRECARNIKTGRVVPEDLYAHVWRFGPDGKVVEFRHIGDFGMHVEAAEPVTATAASH